MRSHDEAGDKRIYCSRTIHYPHKPRVLKNRAEQFRNHTPAMLPYWNTPFALPGLTKIPDFDDAGIGAQRLAGAAVAYASVGDRDKAEKLFAIALDRAKRVRKFTERDQAIREVAVAYAEAGMFEQAADAAKPDNFSYFKIAPLADVAIVMLGQNRDSDVRKVVTMIREARIEERRELQADALAEIAIKYLALGDRRSAAEVLKAAFEIARNAPVNDFQPGIMEKIAVTLAEAGEYTKAIEVVAEIKSKFHQTLALAHIGVVQVKVGWIPDEHTTKILNGMIK